MAANLNKVFLMGNLTRDPEMRHTAKGTAVTSFDIAVNRSFKGGDGDFKKEVSYHKIVAWGKTGENCAAYLSKGRPVLVEGRLQNETYETKEGQKRTITKIVADNVQFLGGGENSDNSQKPKPRVSAAAQEAASAFGGEVDDDAVPF